MYARQLRYQKTEKGKVAMARYRNKPENVERKKRYDDTNRDRRKETANLRYYYKADPTVSVRMLFD